MAEKSKDRTKDKTQALKKALGDIEKRYGKGAIMRLGEEVREPISSISTGALGLDLALGVGGVPRGRITEIYGKESSGKTTLALHIIAEAQKNGGEVAFIDAEHALDPVYAENLGVDMDRLMVSQPDNGEQALEITEALVCSNAVDCIVIDSVAALVPKLEIDGQMGDSHVGLHARLMSQALRKLTGFVNRSRTAVIFINQTREKVGAQAFHGHVPEITTGGRALKFYSTIRMEIKYVGKLEVSKEPVGIRISIKAVKNKVAPPFKMVYLDVMFGKGISKEGNILDMAEDLKLVEKSGTWYSYSGQRMGQGRDNAKNFLTEHPEIMEKLSADITKKMSEMPTRKSGKKSSKDSASKDNTPEDDSEDIIPIDDTLLEDDDDDDDIEMDDYDFEEDDQ